MSADRRAQLKRLLESGECHLQPLTFPQRELWETSPVPVNDVSNHICAFIEVKGVLTPRDCIAAIQRVVERQEVMRLSFLPGKGAPMQMIRANCEANVEIRDLPPHQHTPAALEEAMKEIFLQPFDLMRGPLYRVVILRRTPSDLVLVFTIHHAIADGWSLGVYVQDLCLPYMLALRGVQRPLPPVPFTYSGWGAAERVYWQPTEIASRTGYWKSQLNNLPRLWDDTAVTPRKTFLLQRSVTQVPPVLAREIGVLARRTSTTLFSTLLTAFQLAFSQWSGRDDIVVGTPVANRNSQSVKETMGYFSGNVPLRTHVDRQLTFADAHQAVHKITLDGFAHAMPFAELCKALGSTKSSETYPVYEIRFALQNHPIPDIPVPGLALKLRMRSTGTARFALGCEITEDGGAFEVVWIFRSDLFTQADVRDLDSLFLAMLVKACRTPESRITTLMS